MRRYYVKYLFLNVSDWYILVLKDTENALDKLAPSSLQPMANILSPVCHFGIYSPWFPMGEPAQSSEIWGLIIPKNVNVTVYGFTSRQRRHSRSFSSTNCCCPMGGPVRSLSLSLKVQEDRGAGWGQVKLPYIPTLTQARRGKLLAPLTRPLTRTEDNNAFRVKAKQGGAILMPFGRGQPNRMEVMLTHVLRVLRHAAQRLPPGTLFCFHGKHHGPWRSAKATRAA